jgi:hypothetical protein
MTKSKIINVIAFLIVFQWSFTVLVAQPTQLQIDLERIPEIVSVQKIEQNPFFQEAYEIFIEQNLDHKNPSAGKFKQRVIFSSYNKFSPVVYVTEGYNADYALKSSYVEELSKIVEANQLVVEHRYFGKSMPQELNYDYLTIENACADLHRVKAIFQRLFNNKNKWIATGISKGGQNCMAYKAFYPNDMNVWIPYVAPLNFAIEDGRHEKFLKTVGTSKSRNSILNFQKTVLAKRSEIMPLLDSVISARKYTFRIKPDEVLDFCVLEYQFAFWQWGENPKSIPSDTATTREIFNHLIKVCDPEYFANEGIAPIRSFFVQAAKEFGYYGYDPGELLTLMKIKSAKNYMEKIFLPENYTYSFNAGTSKFIQKAIQKGGDHTIFIYGEYDPWTASAIKLKPNSKAKKVIKPKGSHRTRINNMGYEQQAVIYKALDLWLSEN